MSAKEYKEYKGLRKESLRDNMSDIELALTNIGEITTRDLVNSEKPNNLKDNIKLAKKGGSVANDARASYERNTNLKAITRDNKLNYKYVEEIENKSKK